jgi:ribosomal protein S18 acetylase RimI-like enzyme
MSIFICTVVTKSSRRVLVDGRSVAAGAPPLTHICTVGVAPAAQNLGAHTPNFVSWLGIHRV